MLTLYQKRSKLQSYNNKKNNEFLIVVSKSSIILTRHKSKLRGSPAYQRSLVCCIDPSHQSHSFDMTLEHTCLNHWFLFTGAQLCLRAPILQSLSVQSIIKQVKPGFTNYQPQPKFSMALSKKEVKWKKSKAIKISIKFKFFQEFQNKLISFS